MSTFSFYGMASDFEQIVQAIIDSGTVKILANRSYPSPVPYELGAVDSKFRETVKINRRLNLIGRFTRNLSWIKLKSGEYAGHFEIDQYEDGPVITLDMPLLIAESDKLVLVVGGLNLPSHFRDSVIRQRVAASEEAKDVYRELVAIAKQYLLRKKLLGTSVWVGKEAWQKYEQSPLVHFRKNGRLLR